jgi:hypothetical protein
VAVVVGCGDRGQVLNVSSLALAERKGREGCGWRDRVRFSQQLRTAAKAISKMGDPASQLAQSEEFVGCEERKGRLGRRFAFKFKFKFGGTFSA